MRVEIYGIKNCDTMKKAFTWLDDNGIDYAFHDYKKEGADADVLKRAIDAHGWENVINRRGTSWRILPEDVKAGMDAQGAVDAALENPSLVKRPLLFKDAVITLGFKPDLYRGIFFSN